MSLDRIPIRVSPIVAWALLFPWVHLQAGTARSEDNPQATTFRLIETDKVQDGYPVSYLAASRPDNRVVLDANNGFFDKSEFQAVGPLPSPDWDVKLIKQHFSSLAPRSADPTNARWYVWTEAAGAVRLTVDSAGPLTAVEINIKGPKGLSVQRTTTSGAVELNAKYAGCYLISLSCSGTTSDTRIRQVEWKGPAGKKAHVLRARWRPAAIHTQYHSSTCPKTRLWVFESQSLENASSYSPMSTQFGYFGGSFTSQGVAEGNINFSVWAANSRAKKAPPLSTMPHLISTGNPKASFGGFGHEGSGVKIRDWTPLDYHPRSIVQALRVETIDEHDLFSGYLFDDRRQNWILFAQVKRPVKQRKGDAPVAPTYLRPTSFCEVPGPPNIQRSGDVRRVIRRRGWFFGEDRRWHPVDRQTRRSGDPANQFIQTRQGWLEMATGGIEFVHSKSETVAKHAAPSPSYLSPERTRQLFEYPVTFSSHTHRDTRPDSAIIEYDLKKAGPHATGVLYYGPKDCLTFVKRDLHGTERKGVSSEMLESSRTWANASESVPIKDGINTIPLTQLSAGTTYYYRLLVTNDDGKSWDLTSGSFATPN